ncbi:nodal modulator 3-like protein [Dinothrombium tinctorium]|uniref:Nodal modulator 3-like protein n=1 Tax=Dinothrombium tinctorium TaxID=1965070 RepID=A0A3S3QQR3_9ACAR|nr:nodal modulator 3-like protein [Dinothrombium tinctorium]
MRKLCEIIALLFAFIITEFAFETSGEPLGCGGFVKSFVTIDYSRISLKLYTSSGNLKHTSDCAPNNGYYFIRIYDKGNYVLKIEPPFGWNFEPKEVALTVDGSENDVCSNNKDVNFMFKGFNVSGKVISNTLDSGPEGVELTLIAKSNNNVLQKTTTTANGEFTLKEVVPGTYEIKASESKYRFLGTSSLTIVVNNDSVQLDSSDPKSVLVVAGYNIVGRVASDGEPIKGVQFSLYSKDKQNFDFKSIEKCDKSSVTSKKPVSGDPKPRYICHVISGPDGKFRFETIPPGDYKIVPIYRGKDIQFEVKPDELDISIRHQHIEIKPTFQVEGFSVSGRVLSSKNGKGIVDAQVLLTNGLGTVSETIINTAADGIFHLENIRTGTYTLQITASHILFETTTVKISPASPQIPDITASAFEVCGKLVFTSSPIDLRIGFSRIENGVEKIDQTVDIETDYRFCTFLRPGNYKVTPLVPEKLKREMIFVPKEKIIAVEDVPILDLEFRQFTATVSGKVEYIQKKKLEKNIFIKLEKSGSLVATWDVDKNGFDFTFNSLIPGTYRLNVEKTDNGWCWETNFIEFEIIDKDISNLILKQRGFLLSFMPSNSMQLNILYPDKKRSDKLDLMQANVFHTHCVSMPGIYTITPLTCHKFKEDESDEIFTVDTESENGFRTLHLSAVKHRVTGAVRTSLNISDIVVHVKSEARDDSPDIHLKLELKNYIEVKSGNSVVNEYPFSFWLKSFTTAIIEPTSNQLLFKPTNHKVSVETDCLDNVITFNGRTGLFVSGQIQPKLADVKITIRDRKTENVLFVTNSDASGKYVGGPFDYDDGSEISVSAEKTGYLFRQLWSDTDLSLFGHFESQKLAGIIVKVVDSNDKSNLKDVLISISGGSDNFRKNSITPENGQLAFVGLNPGQYFVRAVLKEFQFEPSSKILDLKQGETVTIEIKGKRVAFSCFGVTNSLNGQPEGGVALEAVGIEGVSEWGVNCSQLFEETVSETNGNFRIRDLQPNCKYEIRLKRGDEKNNHISRSIPSEEVISIKSGSEGKDITGMRLIVFRKMTQMDITGIVNTKVEYLSSLKVKLFAENNPEPPIAVIPLTSSFFSLPTIPIDNRVYSIKLESSLSPSVYEFQTTSVSFSANRSFEHFDFTFTVKQRTSNNFGDQDVIQGGAIYTLPIILLLTFALYNYKTILPFVFNFVENVQSLLASRNASSDSGEASNSSASKKKVKPKKV